jgi:hypothetical protein
LKATAKYSLVTCFGIAMGYLEAVVVVYIRKILSIGDVADQTKSLIAQVPADWIRIEISREVATIVMLVTLALLIEKDIWRRLSVFLWAFAIWDIFYYASLKILTGWPGSLATRDCLFLIPVPWIAPVWLPLLVMMIFLIVSIWILRKKPGAE